MLRSCVEERDGDYVVVREDDGEGVIAEEKEKIFERGLSNNTGMDLTLSREILSFTSWKGSAHRRLFHIDDQDS